MAGRGSYCGGVRRRRRRRRGLQPYLSQETTSLAAEDDALLARRLSLHGPDRRRDPSFASYDPLGEPCAMSSPSAKRGSKSSRPFFGKTRRMLLGSNPHWAKRGFSSYYRERVWGSMAWARAGSGKCVRDARSVRCDAKTALRRSIGRGSCCIARLTDADVPVTCFKKVAQIRRNIF